MEKKIVQRQVADKTRMRIIKAAHKLFAEYGFSGTTTKAIADFAKVNENLIFHHFKNKAELWKQVKAEVIHHIPLEPLDVEPQSLAIFLKSIITQRISLYQQRPDLVRLLQWQRLESKSDQLAADHILAPKNWIAPILHLQKTHKIQAETHAEIIVIWLLTSINAAVFDNIAFLKREKNRQDYIDCLLVGFERALAAA